MSPLTKRQNLSALIIAVNLEEYYASLYGQQRDYNDRSKSS